MPISRTAVLLATVVLLWTFAGSAQEARGQPGGKSALKAVEAALELSRAERRRIQRSLAAAGFEPGPADGLFGRATREAIRKWQASRGEAATGYLDADAAKSLLAAGTRSGALATERQQAPAAKEYSPAARRLSRLLGREFSPAAVDENGWTDLHFAALLNLPELVEALLSAGMRAGGALKSDNKPFDETLQNTLRAFGHNKFAATKRVGQTPLHLVARQNAPDVARLLMDHGADINAKDKDGWTSLHYAAESNAVEVARLLIDRGAEVNAKGQFGDTPLHYAARKNAAKAARLLLDRSAEVNARTTDGFTPLHYAEGDEVARLLLERGADVNARTKHGWTPLFLADNPRVAALLRRHGGTGRQWTREEQVIQLIAKISRSLCHSYRNNNFDRMKKILRKSGQRFLGRVVELEEAYPHVRCYEPPLGDVDLLRVTAENPFGSMIAAEELIHYLVHQAQDKTLLGRAAACKKNLGNGCMNLFGHIEENIKVENIKVTAGDYPPWTKALKFFQRLLHKNLNKADLKYDREFCQQYLGEPKHCSSETP